MKFSIKDLFSNWDQIRKKLILIDSNKHGNANLFFFLTYLERSSHRRCSLKKVFLEISQNSQENTCARVSFLMKLQASGQQKNCEISKNTFSYRTPLVAASVFSCVEL